LLFTVGLLYQTIEDTFNSIWRITSKRSIFMRIAIGTSMLFWGPIMLAVSVSLTERLSALPVLGNYVFPSVVTAAAFTIFYMLIPHARVRLRAALAGALVAALVWEVAKLLFLVYVNRVVSYSAVYGSLGLIPMLFLWVYVNWVIILA